MHGAKLECNVKCACDKVPVGVPENNVGVLRRPAGLCSELLHAKQIISSGRRASAGIVLIATRSCGDNRWSASAGRGERTNDGLRGGEESVTGPKSVRPLFMVRKDGDSM